MPKKLLQQIFFLGFTCLFISCSQAFASKSSELPSWFIQPKQNDEQFLYGVGSGFTLEESTKAALADASARLSVSISSESTLLREENQTSTNEEMRQKIKQNIEKIDFVNFETARSQQIEGQFYIEVKIPRQQFISAQKDKLEFLDRQIFDINKNISAQNLIQKRNSYIKISSLLKQAEIIAQILEANGIQAGLKEKLALDANVQNQLNKLTNKAEFYFKAESEISSIVKNALNKEKIKISKVRSDNENQIILEINSSKTVGQVYGAYITKIKINFENKSAGKIIASNEIEVSGSSTISEKESYAAALEALKERIAKDGVLSVLGII